MSKSQDKLPHNCVYNYNLENSLKLSGSIPQEFERSPRINQTLVVFQEHSPVRICTYGSQNLETWNGDIICNDESVSKPCSWFNPKVSPEESADEFRKLVSDDSYVEKFYPDVAILQWVLEDRIYKHDLSWFDKLRLKIHVWFLTKFKSKSSKSGSDTQLPEDVWES
jgi:hypothetical protein